MATISNVNGKKITKIKYKGEIYDVGGGASTDTDGLKEYLDETKDASYMFCGYANNNGQATWYINLTYERLQKIIKYDTTSNVTNMDSMFYYCTKLTRIPLINTSLVTNMNGVFRSCYKLITIPQLDTSKVTSMNSMFYYCENLTTIPQLDTSKVTSMAHMFYSCKVLKTIDITHMNITSTSNSKSFAQGCNSLTKLIIRNMNAIPILENNAFADCYHFYGLPNPTYNPQGLKDGRIYVPDDKVDELKAATNWSTFADIIVPLSTLVE